MYLHERGYQDPFLEFCFLPAVNIGPILQVCLLHPSLLLAHKREEEFSN